MPPKLEPSTPLPLPLFPPLIAVLAKGWSEEFVKTKSFAVGCGFVPIATFPSASMIPESPI